jgi:hypothetical protein
MLARAPGLGAIVVTGRPIQMRFADPPARSDSPGGNGSFVRSCRGLFSVGNHRQALALSPSGRNQFLKVTEESKQILVLPETATNLGRFVCQRLQLLIAVFRVCVIVLHSSQQRGRTSHSLDQVPVVIDTQADLTNWFAIPTQNCDVKTHRRPVRDMRIIAGRVGRPSRASRSGICDGRVGTHLRHRTTERPPTLPDQGRRPSGLWRAPLTGSSRNYLPLGDDARALQ